MRLCLKKCGRRGNEVVRLDELASRIEAQGGFRRCTWQRGPQPELAARFALRRIAAVDPDAHGGEEREPLWLLIEWRNGEAAHGCAVWNYGESRAAALKARRAFRVPPPLMRACAELRKQWRRWLISARSILIRC